MIFHCRLLKLNDVLCKIRSSLREMYRAYCGNLDAKVTEETLETLLRERGVSPDAVLLKRGYAFIDLPDQNSLDKAIDSLHGKLTSYIVIVYYISISVLSH